MIKKIKKLLLFLSIMAVIGCGRKPIIIKEIENEKIRLTHYIYSDIGDVSDDFFEIVNLKSEEKISIAENVDNKIIDFWVKNDTIFIEHLPLINDEEVIYRSCFGYKLNYIEISSHELFIRDRK